MSELQHHILNLSVAERLQLVSFIISSISEKEINPTIPIPEEWIKEALMRNEAYKSGSQQSYTWEEVKAKIHARK